MCLSCSLSGQGASWSSFSHSASRLRPSVVEDGYGVSGSTLSDGSEGSDMFWGKMSPWAMASVSIAGTTVYMPDASDANVRALESGSKWAYPTLTYSFPDNRWDYDLFNPDAQNFVPSSFMQQEATRRILEGYGQSQDGPGLTITSVEAITNLQFQFAGYDTANIRVGNSNTFSQNHAYLPVVPGYRGDVWFTTEGPSTATNPVPGNYAYKIHLHELGHALGLKHGHEASPFSGVMEVDRDSNEYSVMTYRAYVGHSGIGGYPIEGGSYPQTFMMYDIAALQHMYGANFRTHGGNSTYTWDANTGQTSINGQGQGRPSSGKIFLTIWDGGGIDTYDFSNYNSGASIDLSPGGFSLVSSAQRAKLGDGNLAGGNVYNALQYRGDARSLIENAIGGSGNDKIQGNAANNKLTGNGGNDSLYGSSGNDSLYGGAGNDLLDSISGPGKSTAVWGNDLMYGDAGNDRIYGRYGNDSLYGGDGDDFIDAGEDSDYVSGGLGNDTAIGWAGNDTLNGDAGNDYLTGDAGDDMLSGGMGIDTLLGGDGSDTIMIEAGANYYSSDVLSGGAGGDIFYTVGKSWSGDVYNTTITDFQGGPGIMDRIYMLRSIFSDFSAVKSAAYQYGTDVIIDNLLFNYTGSTGMKLTLKNFHLSSLAADDFVFI